MDKSDETWKAGNAVPEVDKGTEREFIVAVRRVRNGKVYSFSATYLNAYPLNFEQGCPKDKPDTCEGCEDGCPTTGWFAETGDDGEGSRYHNLHLAPGDEIVGWRNIPQWPGSTEKQSSAA